MASLTKSQQLVYDYLCSTMAERAVPPSVREICAATGLRSTSTVHSRQNLWSAWLYHTRCGPESLHSHCRRICRKAGADSRQGDGRSAHSGRGRRWGLYPYPDKSGKETIWIDCHDWIEVFKRISTFVDNDQRRIALMVRFVFNERSTIRERYPFYFLLQC